MRILIIGASSGIGYELWKHYVTTDNVVAVIARRKQILNDMVQRYPENTISECCDIADLNSFEIAFDKIYTKLKGIDLAIVCAGIGELNPKFDIKTESDTIETNVKGWANAVNLVYKKFEEQGKGHLVTITSIGGLQATAIAPAYSASKAFQINYTKSLQAKSKGTEITVTEIRPGLVDTRMAKGEGLFWVMPLEKVTQQITNSIRQKKRLIIVTRRWRLRNWILRHLT